MLDFAQYWWVWCCKQLAVSFTIMGCDGLTASLFKAKHQVDPLVKVLRHILTLQCCLVLPKKITGVWSRDRQDTVNVKQRAGWKCYALCCQVDVGVWVRRVSSHREKEEFYNRKLPEAHGGKTTSPTKLPFCLLPKSRLSLFSRKLESFP